MPDTPTPSTPSSGPAVVVDHLRRTFGDLVAVEDLSLTINRGEVFGMLGPNGSGKTTTIRMLCGILPPTSGTAVVAGIDIRERPDAVRYVIGYMSQQFGLYDDLTAFENLRFYSSVYGVRGAAGAARVEEVIEELGLSHRRNQMVGTLSGGWKQRVSLACAIAHRPSVLFLDEPTAGVDPAARRTFWQTIYEIAARGTSIIVTTHYMDEASRCQRLAFLSRGHLIAVGSPDDVPRQFGKTSIEDVFIELQEQDEAAAR